MIITVQSLSVIAIGDPRSCQGILDLKLFRRSADTPCVDHPVFLGPITEDAQLPLGFTLNTSRCGNASVLLSAKVSVECKAGWLQRWRSRAKTIKRNIAEGEQVLRLEQVGETVTMVLKVPDGTSIIGRRDMPADPVIDSDMVDPRLALDAGDSNGQLVLVITE